MASSVLKFVTFSSFSSGISAGYKVLNSDGSTYSARTTLGVVQPVAGQNTYMALMTLPDAALIVWDDGAGSPTYAFDAFNAVSGGGGGNVQVTILATDLP